MPYIRNEEVYEDEYDDEPPYDGEDEEEIGEDEVVERPTRPAARRLAAAGAARAGFRQLAELTGKETVGVTSVERSGDGWLVGVEVVEDHRTPASIDLLGLYQVQVDDGGELLAYQRVRRYPRGESGVS